MFGERPPGRFALYAQEILSRENTGLADERILSDDPSEISGLTDFRRNVDEICSKL